MSDADGMPALIEHPAPRSTEQRLRPGTCGLIASAMSSIVRSDGAGVAGVPFAMAPDYICILVTKSTVNASAEATTSFGWAEFSIDVSDKFCYRNEYGKAVPYQGAW